MEKWQAEPMNEWDWEEIKKEIENSPPQQPITEEVLEFFRKIEQYEQLIFSTLEMLRDFKIKEEEK